ncbi:DMT family transporter [Phreatobacter stygius]|uniref:DMT family transporter n=1 Tax=Phreatobacter stygius TaxID=1940610 RepID=A0A4D7B0Q9_9HYPH|nr:DMT family transporter [Phreatobacter stygius]QCI63610.1 DMT family transporter [Phreatobacter stygius]
MRLNDNPYLVLAATTLIWAGNAVASRMAVGHVSPMMLTTLRWVGTLAIMVAVAGPAFRQEWPAIKANAWWIAIMGVVGFTGFNALFYLAAQYTTAVNMGIIQGSIPVMVLIGAFLAHRTRITGLQMIGIVVTLVGIVTLATRGHLEQLLGLAFNLGDLLMLVGCLGYAAYTVALRDRPKISPQPFFLGLSAVALISSLPLVAAEFATGTALWPDWKALAIIAYVAVLPGFVAQLLFMRGVELIGPGRAGLWVNLVPVWAAILGPLILGELFAWYHAVALVLVLGGIAVAESGKR